MSDTALYEKAAALLADVPQGCQVLILSEDFAAYNRAVEVCRRIMDHLGKDLDFDFRCWNFVELADPNCAHNAAKYAAVAEIIMLSAQNTVLPQVLGDWLDALHVSRFRAEGALVLGGSLALAAAAPLLAQVSREALNFTGLIALAVVLTGVGLVPAWWLTQQR